MKVPARSRRQGGFTLIEMAIVLVIIGMIIAAVTVGKDTMRTAEQNKVYAKFISPWNQAAYSYFQKTGTVPTGCTTTALCVAEMQKIGVTLPGTYTMTGEDGKNIAVSISKIEDKRAAADGGGMLVTYSAPQQIAYLVDGMMDANLADAKGTVGTGPTQGVVQWTASTATDGDTPITFTVRLRDISGTGSGTAPAA